MKLQALPVYGSSCYQHSRMQPPQADHILIALSFTWFSVLRNSTSVEGRPGWEHECMVRERTKKWLSVLWCFYCNDLYVIFYMSWYMYSLSLTQSHSFIHSTFEKDIHIDNIDTCVFSSASQPPVKSSQWKVHKTKKHSCLVVLQFEKHVCFWNILLRSIGTLYTRKFLQLQLWKT